MVEYHRQMTVQASSLIEEIGMATALSTDADKWSIFCLVNSELMSQVKFACVFGTSGNEALFVTKTDEVYGIGTNCSGCLGLGDVQNSLEPKRVDQLCGKKVNSISCGSGPHLLASTEDGELYTWGHNGYCQLGNGNTNQLLIPQLCLNLSDRTVKQIACGGHHSLILTSDLEVYAWGQNNCGQVGSGNTSNQPTPRRVQGLLANRPVVCISCSQSSSFAVTDIGEVYSWGYNGSGQLGIGTNLNQSTPHKVDALRNCTVQFVVCGFGHTIVLTDEGQLYAWGANSYGQLGIGSKSNSLTPSHVSIGCERFIEIGAIHYSNISTAISHTGKVYAWGLCKGQSVMVPTETNFHTINDVFASLSTPSVTCKPLILSHVDNMTVAESLKNHFDNEELSDITFSVEGRNIFAHKPILRIRCQYFRSMFQSNWAENEKRDIEVTDFSYNVYRAFLEYLYTDTVNLSPEDAIGLLDLANSYCEAHLKRLCERIIKNGIAVDNVFMIYAAAIKYSAKSLEEYCFRFAINHLTAVTQTEAFKLLDELTVKDFFVKAAQYGAFRN